MLTDKFFVCAGVGGTWLEVRCLRGYVAVKSLGTTDLHGIISEYGVLASVFFQSSLDNVVFLSPTWRRMDFADQTLSFLLRTSPRIGVFLSGCTIFLLLPHTRTSQQRPRLISFSTLLVQKPSNRSGLSPTLLKCARQEMLGGIITLAESLEDPECLKKRFCEICNPQNNRTMERHKFHTRSQKQGESIESFTSDLRIKAKCCHFGDMTDELICDRIVCGITSDTLRKALLRYSKLTLAKAMFICRIHEMTEESSKTLATQSNTASVNAVRLVSNRMHWPKPQPPSQTVVRCNNCGGSHAAKREKCPAFGQQCHSCQKFNQFNQVAVSLNQWFSTFFQ